MLIFSLFCTLFNVERVIKCTKGENYSQYTFFSNTLGSLGINTLLSRFLSFYTFRPILGYFKLSNFTSYFIFEQYTIENLNQH